MGRGRGRGWGSSGVEGEGGAGGGARKGKGRSPAGARPAPPRPRPPSAMPRYSAGTPCRHARIRPAGGSCRRRSLPERPRGGCGRGRGGRGVRVRLPDTEGKPPRVDPPRYPRYSAGDPLLQVTHFFKFSQGAPGSVFLIFCFHKRAIFLSLLRGLARGSTPSQIPKSHRANRGQVFSV